MHPQHERILFQSKQRMSLNLQKFLNMQLRVARYDEILRSLSALIKFRKPTRYYNTFSGSSTSRFSRRRNNDYLCNKWL